VKRRILFVHQNFPAQFVHLAPELVKRGHDVLALTAETNQRIQAVPTLRYRHEALSLQDPAWRIAAHFAEQSARGESVALAALQMKRSGYVPDLIFGHPGWGETLFLSDVWPGVPCINYAEFFYGSRGRDVGFDPEFQPPSVQQDIRVQSRKASQLLAMQSSVAAVSPTAWQASTYPGELQSRIHIIHDGINTDSVCPAHEGSVALLEGRLVLKHGDETLTFVSRNMEPYRGFHIFMRILPDLLRRRPKLQVVIVGGDGQSYGRPPPRAGSWKAHMMDEVGGKIDPARVHFVGKLPYTQFVKLMQVTRVHAYLTYPFVLSWSCLEAMSAGALVVGSRTPPVEEFITHGKNGLLVDFFDTGGWVENLTESLANPSRYEHLRENARRTITEGYDLRRVCLPRQIAFVESCL
jgi:glycosyltransferase involved in cell wall biosynthesis